MTERCPLASVPDSIKHREDGFIWPPLVPDACRRCIKRARDDPSVPKRVTLDHGEAAAQELRAMNIDPELVDREHDVALRTGENGLRQVVEESGIDLGGRRGAWPTDRVEYDFSCYVENYEFTERERQMLCSIIIPDYEYRPNGRGDELTSYFYEKALNGEPEVLLAAVYASEDLLEKADGKPMMDEANELKIDRLLAMVADIPPEVDMTVKSDVWQIVLEADWLHWSESQYATEIAIRRLSERDPGFVSNLKHIVDLVVNNKKRTLCEQTGYDKNVVSPAADSLDNEGMSYIVSRHPAAAMTYQSLVALCGVLRDLANR